MKCNICKKFIMKYDQHTLKLYDDRQPILIVEMCIKCKLYYFGNDMVYQQTSRTIGTTPINCLFCNEIKPGHPTAYLYFQTNFAADQYCCRICSKCFDIELKPVLDLILKDHPK